MDFRTNDEDVLVSARPDELIGYTQSINKSAALIAYIQGTDLPHLHRTLYKYTATGEIIIGAKCCKNDEVDVGSGNTCPFNSNFSGFHAHRGGCLLEPAS